MTPKEEISRTLWHLHSHVITQVEAEAIIFPIIDALIAEGVDVGAMKERELHDWMD